jgi:hypothetical protein
MPAASIDDDEDDDESMDAMGFNLSASAMRVVH